MLGLSRKDWLALAPVFFMFALVSTFRAGAAGFIDPDEPFYALTAKEMLLRGDWMTPTLFGSPQFEKPVLGYWVYLALFRVFGVHEWSARLGPSLAGLLTLIATAVLAKALFRRSRTVLLSTAALAASGLFLALSRVVLIDMFLVLFTTAAFAAFAAGWKTPAARPVAWRLLFAFMGLGFLTKGPVGLLLPLGSIAAYAALTRDSTVRALPWKSGAFIFAAIAVPWFAIEAARYDWFLPHFFLHENLRRFFVAEHRSLNTPYFYPLVLLFGFFPWSLLLVSSLTDHFSRLGRGLKDLRRSRVFLAASAAGMFAFFSMASSKLISYLFPLFPLLAVLLGEWLDRLIAAVDLRRAAGRPLIPAPLRLAQLIGWVVVPPALVGGLLWYEADHDLGLARPILAAGLLCIVPCMAAYFLFRTGRVRAALAAILGMTAVFGATAFGWVMPMVEPYFSSRSAIRDFRHDGFNPAAGTLLGSKMSVRGVSYYSGNSNVAVVSGNPKAFFTQHSIPMISANGDLGQIDASHYPVYGLLRPKEVRHLRSILDKRYRLTVVDGNPQRTIVRLEKI